MFVLYWLLPHLCSEGDGSTPNIAEFTFDGCESNQPEHRGCEPMGAQGQTLGMIQPYFYQGGNDTNKDGCRYAHFFLTTQLFLYRFVTLLAE